MSSSSAGVRAWGKAPAALAIVVTAFGAVLAALWCLIAGFWTFSTADYGSFAVVVAVTALLIGAPVMGFRLASKGRLLLSMTVTVPALLLYGAVLGVVLSH
ncbi:MAG: hypothetical protein REJ23_01930 [Brevundimonas sp.]|nr:hypothetical protein [Brevundimonas sp.]